MTDRIDFVIPWVDGGDPAWQKEKNRALHGEAGADLDAGENRYRDWDNLRYWFRAVEKFAPWVHQVFFVTCGQRPDWLNPGAPKLRLVDHRDYIPEQYLPTFNANPIELNLHRIKGLSAQFVYFNDDVFLTAPVAPTDFFRGGLPCDCLLEGPMEFPRMELFNSLITNNIAFANRHFDRKTARKANRSKWYPVRVPKAAAKNALMGLLGNRHFFGFRGFHLAQPFLKGSLEAVWALDPALLDETSSHRFRNARDITQYAVRYYQLLSGRFCPFDTGRMGRNFNVGTQLAEACAAVRTGAYRQVCLNDVDVADFEGAKSALNAAFEALLPEKSSFEL